MSDLMLHGKLNMTLPDEPQDCDVVTWVQFKAAAKEASDRIEELEAKLATCEKYKAAYAECDRIGTQAVRDLEAKLAEAVEERDEALNQLDSARYSVAVLEKRVKTFCDGWGIADKGRIEAEAKLAEAEEALEFYTTCDADGDQDRCGYDGALCCLNARTAVASLQGDKT